MYKKFKITTLLLVLFLRSIQPLLLSLRNKKKRFKFLNSNYIGKYNYIIVGKGPNYLEELELALEVIKKDNFNLFPTKIISINGINLNQINANINIYELCNFKNHPEIFSDISTNTSRSFPILIHGRVRTKVWGNALRSLKNNFNNFYIWERIGFLSRIKISRLQTFEIIKNIYFILKKLNLPIFIWLRGSIPSLIIYLSFHSKFNQIFIVGSPLAIGQYQEKREVISLVDSLILSFYIAKKANKKINFVSLGKNTNPKIMNCLDINLIGEEK